MGVEKQVGKTTKRKTKNRINFSLAQLDALEAVFAQYQYPDAAVLRQLAKDSNLPMEKICTWFQNRRAKFRKGSKTGHIMWMRNQLFTSDTRATPYVAPNAAYVAPPADDAERVLTPSVLTPPTTPTETEKPADTDACAFVKRISPDSSLHHYPSSLPCMPVNVPVTFDITDSIQPITAPTESEFPVGNQSHPLQSIQQTPPAWTTPVFPPAYDYNTMMFEHSSLYQSYFNALYSRTSPYNDRFYSHSVAPPAGPSFSVL